MHNPLVKGSQLRGLPDASNSMYTMRKVELGNPGERRTRTDSGRTRHQSLVRRIRKGRARRCPPTVSTLSRSVYARMNCSSGNLIDLKQAAFLEMLKPAHAPPTPSPQNAARQHEQCARSARKNLHAMLRTRHFGDSDLHPQAYIRQPEARTDQMPIPAPFLCTGLTCFGVVCTGKSKVEKRP